MVHGRKERGQHSSEQFSGPPPSSVSQDQTYWSSLRPGYSPGLATLVCSLPQAEHGEQQLQNRVSSCSGPAWRCDHISKASSTYSPSAPALPARHTAPPQAFSRCPSPKAQMMSPSPHRQRCVCGAGKETGVDCVQGLILLLEIRESSRGTHFTG